MYSVRPLRQPLPFLCSAKRKDAGNPYVYGITVEQAKNELFQDAGFGEFYKRYLDADLENPELRDELLDYFVDKIYIDDDGKLSFVLKLYDKDEVELQEVPGDELFEFVGVEVFDNFVTCSTTTLEADASRVFFCL